MTKIEWADKTWQIVSGCDPVSEGCKGCYSAALCGTRLKNNPKTEGLTRKTRDGRFVFDGTVRCHEDALDKPLHWTKPRDIFPGDRGDLFHGMVPDDFRDRTIATALAAAWHRYYFLTKRAGEAVDYLLDRDRLDRIGAAQKAIDPAATAYENVGQDALWPVRHIHFGFSAEDQPNFDARWTYMRELALRGFRVWLSAEPLLGPIDASEAMPYLSGVVAGGASGQPGYNPPPMHPDWPRRLRDQCAEHGVPFQFKQWGEWLPVGQSLPGYGKIHGATGVKPGRMKLHYGGTPQQAPRHAFAERGVDVTSTSDGRLTFRVGKKAAGNTLDGRQHLARPGDEVSP